ncbi:helix-turn-helix transcriptional regulator [Bifidobacterium longum]|uniref:helix-turn-helix domain-containing protein n=1 Tax=Bifidobacterium longum TaxID=216816 RepID=UPI00321AA79A
MKQSDSSIVKSGRRVATLLASNGMSQAELAQSLGQSNASISRKISGELKFSSTDYLTMADLFHVSVDVLMGRQPLEVVS